MCQAVRNMTHGFRLPPEISRQGMVIMPVRNSVRKDFAIFLDPGFLVSLALIGLLTAGGVYILV